MAKKESVVKAIGRSTGRFVANELLGVDDARRAIAKAKQGDIKGAVKSAATAVAEAGSTALGAGVGAKIGAKVGLKAGEKAAETAAVRAGQTAKETAEKTLPKAQLGKQGGEIKSVRTNPDTSAYVYKQGHNPVTKPRVEVTEPKRVVYRSPENTMKQREGVKAAQEKSRENKIYESAQTSYESSRSSSTLPKEKEIAGKLKGGAGGLLAVAATKQVESPQGTQPNHHTTSVDRKTGKAN